MTFTSFIIATQKALESMGALGLFILAFIEASFFPIPPDVVLIPLVLLKPSLGLVYALIATIGSVLGAIFGYFIGKKGGRPLLNKLIKKENVERVDRYYEKYGDWAVGIAGFTPIPYKVFSISSGVFNHNLKNFILISLISRGLRFFIEALVLMFFGEQIVGFLKVYWGPTTLAGALLAAILYFLWIKWKKSRN